jgi:hypothetical protein
MRHAAAAAAVLIGLAAPAALAQGTAALVAAPTRDVAVSYRATGGREAGELRIVWLASEEKMRVETPGGALIRDNRAKRDIMLMNEQRMFIESGSGQKGSKGLVMAGPDDTVTPEGADRVAGLDCTVWRIVPKKDDADDGDTAVKRACMTADGVPLRVVEGDGANRKTTVATKVDYGRQDPALFSVPEGKRGKTCGGQAGWQRARTRSGRYGMGAWPVMPSLAPR